MKLRNLVLGLFAMLLIGTAGPVFAHHGGYSHVRFGFYIGAPLWGPWDYPYYYSPYPYYARMVTPPPPPPPSDVMAEPSPGGPTQQPYYRNYCSNLNGYYPKVKECPGVWQLR
jgi:hypothetical protein